MADLSIEKTPAKSKAVNCKTLQDYLKILPINILDNLYNHPITCLAVFRELSEIAKHYIMRTLFLDQPVPQAVITSWLSKTYAKEHQHAVDSLLALRIWHEASVQSGLSAWNLNPVFKKNTRIALLGGGDAWSLTAPKEADSKPRDIAFLDAYAKERWEYVLHYMVGSKKQDGVAPDAVTIILHSGLMNNVKDEGLVISKEGFQFLLMDTSAQVWYFILQYLDYIVAKGFDLATGLPFLFQLQFSILGKAYCTTNMSDEMRTILQQLREFGLVYQRRRKDGIFYPTRLAVNMSCSANQQSIDNVSTREGYIIVETNYRVYAYTDSDLQVNLVGLFCEMQFRFPNVAIGIITRDSIRAALRSGIKAEQIIGFLKMHAHPKMLATGGSGILPPSIVDQIYLWEQERNRFTFQEGVLYSQFVSQNDYDMLRNYARDSGVLIWENPTKRNVVVIKSGHEDVKRFWKRHNKNK